MTGNWHSLKFWRIFQVVKLCGPVNSYYFSCLVKYNIFSSSGRVGVLCFTSSYVSVGVKSIALTAVCVGDKLWYSLWWMFTDWEWMCNESRGECVVAKVKATGTLQTGSVRRCVIWTLRVIRARERPEMYRKFSWETWPEGATLEHLNLHNKMLIQAASALEVCGTCAPIYMASYLRILASSKIIYYRRRRPKILTLDNMGALKTWILLDHVERCSFHSRENTVSITLTSPVMLCIVQIFRNMWRGFLC